MSDGHAHVPSAPEATGSAHGEPSPGPPPLLSPSPSLAHFTEEIKVNGRGSSEQGEHHPDLHQPPLPISLAGRWTFLDSSRSKGDRPPALTLPVEVALKVTFLGNSAAIHGSQKQRRRTDTRHWHRNKGSEKSPRSPTPFIHIHTERGLCRQHSKTRGSAIQPNRPGRS